MTKITELKVERWKEIRHIFEMFSYKWVFRGQRESTWQLSTPFKRIVDGFNFGRNGNGRKNHLKKLELDILKNFKARAHHYLNNLPNDNNYLEWFSLLIHHGAPSRFLNWTRSPYVASYFALEDTTKDSKKTNGEIDWSADNKSCAVWALNLEWCEKEAFKTLRKWMKNKNVFIFNRLKDVIFNNDIPFVVPVKPSRLNERITIQQGILLCVGNSESNMEDNLKGYSNIKNNIIKIIIPKAVWIDGLMELNRMNINRATLFPGIDGFAESLGKTSIPTYWYEQHSHIPKNQQDGLSRFLGCNRTFYITTPNVSGMLHDMTKPFNDRDINIESIIQTQLSHSQQWVFDVQLKKKYNNSKAIKLIKFELDPIACKEENISSKLCGKYRCKEAFCKEKIFEGVENRNRKT